MELESAGEKMVLILVAHCNQTQTNKRRA